ncbi:hypothetical protein EZ449_14455 [Pedobacter frigidisoli]|uniref:DUF5672 domain-containing protein n=1 Tax=Pedobacter frigidisoli TaxID=2530455 RepID=A0A4R0NZ70_9SPHI|nr:DUF5672 family protein [Pedobacter frigidisoli]TCD07731.1 hypothetical protein EZ449_14455 [Pedobacter frigidisoli]
METLEYMVSIIIPVYKRVPDADEVLSLRQCQKILNHYKIYFVAPKSLDCTEYINISNSDLAQVIRFDDFYFQDITGYNNLMLSPIFYKTFIKYRYILIHQLDAFVFKDDLLYWCKQKYDFIGAPNLPHQNRPGELQFLKNYRHLFSALRITRKISNVGNGGLSLRKTRSCYLLVRFLKHRVKKWGINNEDGFFKYWGNILHPLFNLPDDDIAIRFAVELEPEKSLKKLNNQLPFGCHAFRKYEWSVWKPFIENPY